MSTHLDQIATNRDRFQRTIEGIRNDGDLSDAAKRRHLTEAYTKAVQTHNALKQETLDAEAAEYSRRTKKAFGLSFKLTTTEAEKIAIQASYRGALAMAMAADSPAAIKHLQTQAEVSGDELLHRATLAAAHEKGFTQILAEAAVTDPNIADFLDASDDRKGRAMLNVATAAPQRPAEVDANAAFDATIAARRTG